MSRDYEKLSKLISYILRHKPWLYELELDNEGWVSSKILSDALRIEFEEWSDLSKQDLIRMIELSGKNRHEIGGDKIRALYGHSTPSKIKKQKTEPPQNLYHGTSPKLLRKIYESGLKPMSRHYVHLSADRETAMQVGSRKAKNPTILMIQAKKAHDEGIDFYQASKTIWLSDYIPSKFISPRPELE